MTDGYLFALIGLAGSLILAIVAVLNLITSRQLLRHVSKQLDIAENQSEMQLIRNAFVEMSEFLKIFVDKPHLRPYFYEAKPLPQDDHALKNEVAALAEWILTNFATAITLAALLPTYPIGALLETLRFHLRHSPAMQHHLQERFSGFPVSGLALLRLRFDTKHETSAELEKMRIAAHQAGNHRESERISRLMELLENSPENADLLYASLGLAAARASELSQSQR